MKKTVARVMKIDYENDTTQVMCEIEAQNIAYISASSVCDDGSISISTKSGDRKCFTNDYYSTYYVEFCQV